MALLNKNSPYPAILAACFGVFIAADDQTVIVTILPSIMSDFRLGIDDLGQVSWTVTGYLLGYTAVLPLMGRISDVHGHRRVYLLAMGIFLVGSVLAAMANGLWTLVGFRVIQAVGGGAVVPVTIAMIGDLLPPGRRGMALGIMGASAEMGAVIGPLWGSLIDRFLDWRWVFWMNVPLVIIVVVLIMLLAPSGQRYPRPVDYRGGLILALVMVLVTLALSRLGEAPVQAGAGLALGGLLLAGFLWSQSRASFPLTPLSLFRRVSFSAANASHFFVGAALIIAMVNIPLITDTVMGKEPLEGGLRLLRLTGAIPVGALAGGFAASRLGYRLPTAAGLLLGATSFYFLSTWDLELSDPMMTVHLLIGGLGFGLVIAPIATAAINSVPPEDRGTAAALLTVMRMMGMIVGLAALTSWGTDRFDTLVRGIDLSLVDPGYINEVTSAGLTVFEGFFLTAMALCLLALVPTWLMRGEKHGVQSSTVPIGGTGDTSWGR